MQNAQAIQIDLLRQRIARLEGGVLARDGAGMPSGCAALDAILPEKGFRPGTLVEWLAYNETGRNEAGRDEGGVSLSTGTAAATLAFFAAVAALRRSEAAGNPGSVVVIDPWGEFYPPAAVRLGIDPARLIVVHPGSLADGHWAFDQSLRCSAVAAAIAWPDAASERNVKSPHLPTPSQRQPRSSFGNRTSVDGRIFRRLQLAAEGGRGLGLMIRPARVRHEPSWADVRILVEPLPGNAPHGVSRRLRVTLLRCRSGGMKDRSVELEIPT